MVYWIWLNQLRGIGPVKQRSLLNHFQSPDEIFRATEADLIQCEGIGAKLAHRIVQGRSLEESYKILNRAEEGGIKLLTINDTFYPKDVKMIDRTPILLYYKGHLPSQDMKRIAVLGTRNCTSYGKEIAQNVGSFLASQGICLIMGLSTGIERYAHTACFNKGGVALGVLANGPDICHPSNNNKLIEEIVANGAVLSEFPPGRMPNPSYFPCRNRLLSAWSHSILIVEATEKSNCLTTAKYGEEYGREILAAPNSIYQESSKGTNRLLLQGAKIFLDNFQLLQEVDVVDAKNVEDTVKTEGTKQVDDPTDELLKSNHKELNREEKKIVELLMGNGPKSIDELSILTKIDSMTLLEIVALMELEGLLEINGSMCNVK